MGIQAPEKIGFSDRCDEGNKLFFHLLSTITMEGLRSKYVTKLEDIFIGDKLFSFQR